MSALTPAARSARFRWTIGRKLGAAFAAVVLLFVVAMTVAINLQGSSQAKWRGLDKWSRAQAGIAQVVTGVRQQLGAQAMYAATFDPKYKAEWERGVAISDAGGKQADAVSDPTTTRIARAAVAADHLHDKNVTERLFPAVAAGDHVAALAALKIVDGYVRVPLKANQQIAAYIDRRRTTETAAAQSAADEARTASLIAMVLGTLLAIGVAMLITRSLVRRVRRIGAAAAALAAGRTDIEIDTDGSDELADTARAFEDVVGSFRELAIAAGAVADGDLTVTVTPRSEQDTLGKAFAAMVERLRTLVDRISRSARDVSTASVQMAATSDEAGRAVGEIASAVTDVATGAERQVRALGEANGATVRMTDATTRSASDARATAQAAGDALRVAQDGASAASEATDAMSAVRAASEQATVAIRDLGEKSSRVGGIVETITNIAEQTNLLALNAAIEAARAGDQGRGFAVVADEVRKLAEESQRAAQSIGQLLGEIQAETSAAVAVVEAGAERTEQGTRTVESARASFTQLGTSVSDVAARVEAIADTIDRLADDSRRVQTEMAEVASVAEQSSASAEEVAASSQQTSAGAQEIASSAQELALTANELSELVGAFRV
jgi:methyl-accepting chemotaxis protein